MPSQSLQILLKVKVKLVEDQIQKNILKEIKK